MVYDVGARGKLIDRYTFFGVKHKNTRLMVHSDFKRFLSEAGKKLSIGAIYIFTEEGGEVESTEEILHDDVLWVSSGALY